MSNSVILVNPPIYDFAAYDLFAKPLGLLYVGSLLKRAGVSVHLVDALDRGSCERAGLDDVPAKRRDGAGKYYREKIATPTCLSHIPRQYSRYGMGRKLFEKKLAEAYERYRPGAVLVTSMMTYWYPVVADTIATVRRLMPGTPVGLGGVYATLMPEHAMRVCRPDRLFAGVAVKELLSWLKGFDGIELKADCVSDDFTDWPRPAYELYSKLDYLTVVTSVGCPYRCSYCASSVIQPRLLQLKPEVFILQLQELVHLFGERRERIDVAFIDDALLANAEDHFVSIMKQVQAMGKPFRFHCPNGLHGRFITPDVARLMFDNRFEMVRISYESATEGTARRASDGKISNRHFESAIENLTRAGYKANQLNAYLMTGLPGQGMDEVERSAEAVHRMGVGIRLCQYTPIPKTPLFQEACERYGLDPDEPLLHNNSILPGWDWAVSFEGFQQFKEYVSQLNHKIKGNL